MKGMLLAQLLLTGLPDAAGHAYIFEPAARNMIKALAGEEDCPHCGMGGGAPQTMNRAKQHWPTNEAYGSHGLCGDNWQGREWTTLQEEPYLKYTTKPQRTYTAGSSVGIVIAIATHHMGHFEFRLCDKQLNSSLESFQAGQECLNQWVLERVPPEEAYGDCVVNDRRGDCQPVDPNNPGRWYLPPSNMEESSPGADWSDLAKEQFKNHSSSRLQGVSSLYFMWYKIPENISCSQCTLQWYWASGNTCLYDEHYFSYFKKMQSAGWSAKDWSPFAVSDWANCDNACCGHGQWGEEFWNCADVEVVAAGSSPFPTAPVHI